MYVKHCRECGSYPAYNVWYGLVDGPDDKEDSDGQ